MKLTANAKTLKSVQENGFRNQNNTSVLLIRAAKFVLFCTSVLAFYLTPMTVHADKVLILGDSLSAAYKIPWESGWVQLMSEDLSEEHQVINASVSGETTGGGLARLPSLLDEYNPDWVIVELGGNDGLRGYPLNLISDNLTNMGKLITDHNAKPVFFGIRIPPNYGQRYNDAFKAIFTTVSSEFDAPYLDLFIEEITTNPEMMQDDKIHPSELAQPIIRDKVIEFLESVFSDTH